MVKLNRKEIVNWLLIVAGALVVLIIRCQSRLGDSDFFWHITLGRDILQNGTIPVEDTYSWLSSEYGLVETAHSWLSSVCLYLFTIPFSEDVFGAVCYAVVTFILFQLVVYFLFIRRICSSVYQNAATIISIFAGIFLYENARPQNIGYIIFVVALYLLIRLFEEGNFKHLLLLPLVSVCWANFHGGSVPMLFAFNAMFLVLTFIPDFEVGNVFSCCPNRKKARKCLLGALGINLVSGLLNPYNISLYIYFFVTNNTVTKKYVTEWQCGGIISISSLFALLCFFYLFIISKKSYPLHKVLPLVITFLLSGVHIRIGNYSYIFVIILLCDAFAREGIVSSGKRLKCVPTAILTGVLAAFAVMTVIGSGEKLEIQNTNPLSDGVKSFLSENRFCRMYNMYDAGGYLIYEGYQSFVDSRADLFTDEILEDNFALQQLSLEDTTQVEAIFDKYKFDSLLVMKCKGSKPLMCYMSLMEEWEKGYEDEEWVVYIPVERKEN